MLKPEFGYLPDGNSGYTLRQGTGEKPGRMGKLDEMVLPLGMSFLPGNGLVLRSDGLLADVA